MKIRQLDNATSWASYYKLKEGDQAAQPAPQQAAAQQPTQQPAQAQSQNQPAQAGTEAQTQPQTQPAQNQENGNQAAAPAQQAPTSGNTSAPAQGQTQAQAAPTTPQSQIVAQNAQNNQAVQESLNATSWAAYNRIKESIALPGGNLDLSSITDYEKELDKHNKARKDNKVCGFIGDKDAGEIGVHDYDEKTGMPTAKITDILKPRKSSKLILTGK